MTAIAETAEGGAEIRELQASIEQSTIRRASLLSMAEKFRLGADLYDDGMRWLIQIIKAERPEWSELMVDQELERRKAIKRRVEEAGRFRVIEGEGGQRGQVLLFDLSGCERYPVFIMPRRKRVCPKGDVFHVLNRAVARLTIFEKPEDYDAFLQVIDETWEIVPLPIHAMVLMPNHWHFVVRPTTDDQVSEFFRRLTVRHTMRYHAHYGTGGTGHLYQGRFKSFPIQSDEHLLIAMRYVERNPVRANLVELAEDWVWGSAHARRQSADQRRWLAAPVDPPLPRQWRSRVNKPESEAELSALRHCIQRGLPFGDDRWVSSSAVRLSLESTTRPRGRPRKES